MADERTPRRLAVRERGERTYTVGIDKNYARTYTENEMRAMGTEFPDENGNRVVTLEREHSDAANFATKKYYENLGYEVEDAGRQFIARIPWQKHQDYLKKVQDPYLKMLNPNPYEGKDPDGFKYSIEQDGVVSSGHTSGETIG